MGLEWADDSSYSQGQRGKVEPTVWRATIGKARISVHRYHGVDGHWFVTCDPWMTQFDLGKIDIEDAKEIAVGLVKDAIDDYHNAWARDYLTVVCED